MDKKIIKRGYNFTEELVEEWEKFHFPSKDYSPSAAGAFLVWMSLPPDIRELAKQAAFRSNVKKSIEVMKEILPTTLAGELITSILSQLPENQRADLIQQAIRARGKLTK